MLRRPFLVVPVLGLAMLPVCYLVLAHVASRGSSISENWLLGSGLLVVFAVVFGYWLSDGRDPMSPGHRIGYSLLAALLGGTNSLLGFVAISRAWKNASLGVELQGFWFQVANPGVFGVLGRSRGSMPASTGMGWMEIVGLGAVVAGFATFASFKHFNENAVGAPGGE